MSTESPDMPEIPDFSENDNRRDVCEDFEEVMDEAFRKFTVGRVRNPENEEVRIKWLRAYVYAVSTYRSLVNDIEATEHDQRIARLEEALDLADAED